MAPIQVILSPVIGCWADGSERIERRVVSGGASPPGGDLVGVRQKQGVQAPSCVWGLPGLSARSVCSAAHPVVCCALPSGREASWPTQFTTTSIGWDISWAPDLPCSWFTRYSVILMQPLPALGRYGLMAFRWVTLTSVLIALAMALYPMNPNRDPLVAVTSGAMRCASILELCLLAFIVVSMQTLRLSARSWEFGVSHGIGYDRGRGPLRFGICLWPFDLSFRRRLWLPDRRHSGRRGLDVLLRSTEARIGCLLRRRRPRYSAGKRSRTHWAYSRAACCSHTCPQQLFPAGR